MTQKERMLAGQLYLVDEELAAEMRHTAGVLRQFNSEPEPEARAALLRGLLGALAVIAAQLVLAMVIRSFAVPIFLGLLGGITGIFISSKGFGLLWPYSLMQLGMNSNKSADALAGSYALFAFSGLFWLAVMFALAWLLLRRQDVRA
mgnify:CR=1 FL=1